MIAIVQMVAQNARKSIIAQTSSQNNIETRTANVACTSGIVQSHHTSVSEKVMLATASVKIISFGTFYIRENTKII